MAFHPDIELRNNFQGYQGPHPLNSSVIFLGKDANFPHWGANPHNELDWERRSRVLSFLGNGDWRNEAEFRFSQLYENRNAHPLRAHHPFLLNCFPGNKGGAPYHGKMARLIDRVLEQNEAFNDNQIVTRCTFVELVSYPTVGNNGDALADLFNGNTPNGWEECEHFEGVQENHRNNLRTWLIDERGNGGCTVFIPRSVFEFLCRNNWETLNNNHLNQMNEYFLHNPNTSTYEAVVVNGNNLIVTRGFPYFRNWNAVNINTTINEVASIFANALNP